jgi:hypothetical protein
MKADQELPRDKASRPCEWCGEPVPQPATGRPKLHCKRSHRQRAFEARRLRKLRELAGLEPPSQ